MATDIQLAAGNQGKLRRDWGLQNMVSDTTPTGIGPNVAQDNVRRKINTFLDRAVYPQQLSVPRQYSSTKEGVSIFKILKGRIIDGLREDGVRAVALENAQRARFVISPLFSSEHDAVSWARQNMGA